MNALSLQHLGSLSDPLAWRLASLDVATQRAVVQRAVMEGAKLGIARWAAANRWRKANGLSSLGQEAAQGLVAAGVQAALAPMVPVIGQKILEMAKPAIEKSMQMIGPVIDEKVSQYGPRLALIMGLSAALLSILGMVAVGAYVVSKIKR